MCVALVHLPYCYLSLGAQRYKENPSAGLCGIG